MRAEPSGGLSGDQDEDASIEPDFAELFPVRSCEREHAHWEEEMECDVCGKWRLTPRTADMLYTVLENLSDEAYDDVDEHDSDPLPARRSMTGLCSPGFPGSPGRWTRTGAARLLVHARISRKT